MNVGSAAGDGDGGRLVTGLHLTAGRVHEPGADGPAGAFDPRRAVGGALVHGLTDIRLRPAVPDEHFGRFGRYDHDARTGTLQATGANEVVAVRFDDLLGGPLRVGRDRHVADGGKTVPTF